MYKLNTICLENETKGSYSKAVIGIVIITITLTVVLSFMGVWDGFKNGNQEENFEMPFIPQNKVSEESSSVIKNSDDLSKILKTSSEKSEDKLSEKAISGPGDVLVPEGASYGPFDTERGEIIIVDDSNNLPTTLPLKIDDEYLADYWVTVATYGGYEWESGEITVKQLKIYADFSSTELINIGYIKISGVEIIDDGDHRRVTYNLTFTVSGNHPIMLDSNHVPSVDSPWWVRDGGHDDLNKPVYLYIETIWSGCPLPEQQFMVILAHKTMSQKKSPTLDQSISPV